MKLDYWRMRLQITLSCISTSLQEKHLADGRMPGRRRSQRQHHQASKASIKEVNAKFRKFGAKYNNTGITKRPVVLNLASIGDRDFVGLQAQVNGVP